MQKKVENIRVKWDKLTEIPLLVLSLIFLVTLIIPVAHPVSSRTKFWIERTNYIIWAIFVLDYLFKLISSPKKLLFIKSNIFELLVVAVPVFRPLRLLRFIPTVLFFLNRSKSTLSGKILNFAILAAVLVVVPASVLIFQVEHNVKGANIKTLGDSLWWAISTVTTVGYGDKFPITTTGKCLAAVVMLVGISLLGVITAAIASWFVKSDEEIVDQNQLDKVLAELQEIKKRLDFLQGK